MIIKQVCNSLLLWKQTCLLNFIVRGILCEHMHLLIHIFIPDQPDKKVY